MMDHGIVAESAPQLPVQVQEEALEMPHSWQWSYDIINAAEILKCSN